MDNNKLNLFYQKLKASGLTEAQEELILRELNEAKNHTLAKDFAQLKNKISGLYDKNDFEVLMDMKPKYNYLMLLQTIDELLEQDKQREKDGFPRRIRLGKLVRPIKGNQKQVIVVPSTTETKFYHDDSITDDEDDSTGGTGEEGEGEVIGEQKAQPQQGEGEGDGAGQGGGGDHDMTAEAFDLGRILTEKFDLPNLKLKGNKKSLTKIVYDLTDIHQGSGQILDKKATLKKIVQTNILLGNVKSQEEFSGEDFLINPTDKVYHILSPEKDVESQAIVFFLRDYSGSMQGKPSEVISTQHLFIYSWLMYQYNNQVESRFILHDSEAKEVDDFYTYYKSTVAGGTNVFPAYELVDQIVEKEQLAKDYNIYIFHGTDGDDWDNTGEKVINITRKMLTYANRIGITVAKNNWSAASATIVERYLDGSGLLRERPDLIRMDSLLADSANEGRIIEGIKKLTS